MAVTDTTRPISRKKRAGRLGGKCQPAVNTFTPTDMDNTNTLKQILIISTELPVPWTAEIP